MSGQNGPKSERISRPLLFGFLSIAILISLIGIGFLALDVSRKIRAQDTASSDNVQWSLSQIDIEFLAFALAIEDAQAGRTSLKEVRKRFDVFYSRMNTVERSQVFAPLRHHPDYPDLATHVKDFLDRTTPYIDGSDATLTERLPALSTEVASIRPDTRKIALLGIDVFSGLTDQEREGVGRTLLLLALLTGALVLSLASLIASLLWLDRVNRRNVERNLMTLARMEAIVTSALDGVIVADRHGRIIEFNPAAEVIFGYTQAEALGAEMSETIIPDHLRAAHQKGMERYLKTGERHVIGRGRIRLQARRKDGSIFPVEVSIARVDSDTGEIFISFLRDLSAEVAAEQELMKARDDALAGEKAKADFLAVMSHEMRTPLNGMLGTIELLDDTQLTARQRDYLRIMGNSGRLLLQHVNSVLDISRLESGKMTVEKVPVDLDRLIRDIVESQRGSATSNGNRLRAALPTDGRAVVMTDPMRLRQILLNLVGNAIKFTRNGEVAIEVEHLDHLGLTEFRVIDTGIGILPEHLDHIFEDFVTLDPSYSRTAEGTGLGLGIARRLVNAMGGEIGVESEPEEGSLFWFRLPLEVLSSVGEEKAVAVRGGTTDADQIMPLSILVVEDNPVNRLVVRELLSKDGHLVDEAHDGEEGVRFAGQRQFDLILMDISMPRKDGIAATREIRSGTGASNKTPIIALTAHALPEETRRFLDAGMQAVLRKPVSRKALRDTIADLGLRGGTLAPPTPEPSQALDTEILAQITEDLGRNRIAGFLDEFATSIRETCDKLADGSLIEKDPDEARRIVHKLAGSAGMFGAAPLNDVLARIETALKTDKPDQARAALPSLAHHAQATVAEITRFRSSEPAP